MSQLRMWSNNIINNLNKNGLKKVKVRTILTTSPSIAEEFRQTDLYKKSLIIGFYVTLNIFFVRQTFFFFI